MKKILTWLLVASMVLGMVPPAPLADDGGVKTAKAAAADEANWLQQAKWVQNGQNETYTISPTKELQDLEIDDEETIKVFSISVDNRGYFTWDKGAMQSFVGANLNCDISGLCLSGDGESAELEYINKNKNLQEDGTRLASLTVQAKGNDGIDRIYRFLNNLVFHRNGETGEQNVTVAYSKLPLEDRMTAVALPDGLHYYRYVPWDSNKEEYTWHYAYKQAKSDTYKYNGMKGYLATITSDLEQIYICRQIMNLDSSASQGDGAWIGGVRTNLSDANGNALKFDADTMDTVYPGERTSADLAKTWYWVCGPEAGHSFYRLENGLSYFGTSAGCDESYTKWYDSEPNNTQKWQNDYKQEYCLEYGYDEKGAWNDLWPEDGSTTVDLWKMTGFLIEYSPYTRITDSGTPEEIKPDDAKFDVRTIPKDIEDTKYYVDAKDFIVGLDTVGGLDEQGVIAKSEAKILDPDGNAPTGNAQTKPEPNELADLKNQKTPGDLPLTFKGTVDSTEAAPDKVTVHVVDKSGSETDNNGTTVQVGGNHFTISYEDLLKDPTADNPENIGEKAVESLIRNHAGIIALKNGAPVPAANVKIKELGKGPSGSTPDGSKKLTNVIQADARGVYQVELSYEEGGVKATATIEVTVLGYPRIKANDLILSVKQAEDISNEQIKEAANADVYSASTSDSKIDGERSKIAVTPSPEKPSVNEMGKNKQKGQTKVTFTHPEQISNQDVDPAEINVTIVDEATQDTGDDDKVIQIGGNNFTISKSFYDEVKEDGKQFAEMLKAKSEVLVLEDGTVMGNRDSITAIASAQPKSSTEAEDKYDVTLTYDGVSTTVTMTVTKETSPSVPTPSQNPNKPTISASDFLVTVDEVKNITSGTVVDKAGATVSDGGTPTVAGDSITALKNATKDGTVPVQFDDDDADSKTVTATVKDKVGAGIGMTASGKVQIGANNFTIDLAKAQDAHDGKSNDLLKELAKVVALENGGPVDISKILVTNPQIIGVTPGTYEGLEFSYDGVPVKVNVTVGDAGTKDPNVTGGGDQPTVSPDPGEDKTFELTNPKDVLQPVDPAKKVQKVTLDDNEIPATDYTVTDGVLTISKERVGTLPVGDHPVVITYTDGTAKQYTIHVIDYDESTVIKHVPVLKLKKVLGVKQKFDLNLVGINKNAKKIYKSSKKKVAKINKKGVITAKKKGKCVVKAFVIQNGSYYKVKVNLTVKKRVKNYNLKKKAISKKVKGGKLPEFNVYKRVYKNKKATLKFNSVAKKAKIKYTSKNKKIATVKKKGKKCVILGKKQGFTIVTAKIRQHGKLYVTRIVVRVDDHKKNKQLKKWLK